ncbi:MAG: hypothetical protein ABJP45_10035 [Cyclobacteriaceae bacterium]
MKREIKSIARWVMVLFITAMLLPACESADEEIFDNADVDVELETDEEDEKKSKPIKSTL